MLTEQKSAHALNNNASMEKKRIPMRKPLVFLFIHWLSLTFATNAAYCCCADGLLFQIWIISIAFENVWHQKNGKTLFQFFRCKIMETTTISMHCMAWLSLTLETIDFLLKIRKVLLQRCAQHIWTDLIDWQTTAAFSVGFFLLFPLWFIPNTIQLFLLHFSVSLISFFLVLLLTKYLNRLRCVIRFKWNINCVPRQSLVLEHVFGQVRKKNLHLALICYSIWNSFRMRNEWMI